MQAAPFVAWGSGQCGRPHREIRDRTLCHRLHGDTALVNDRAIMRGIISALMHHDLTWPNSRTVRGQEPMNHKKSPEEYRRLADKCRETARTVSAEKWAGRPAGHGANLGPYSGSPRSLPRRW